MRLTTRSSTHTHDSLCLTLRSNDVSVVRIDGSILLHHHHIAYAHVRDRPRADTRTLGCCALNALANPYTT